MSPSRTPKGGIPISDAARAIGCSVSTIQRMIRRGAPTLRPGAVGRNHGAVVCLDDLARWKSPDTARLADEKILNIIGVSLWDAIKRDHAHARANISEREAAAVLVIAFGRIYQNLTHRSLDDLEVTGKMRHVCNISVG